LIDIVRFSKPAPNTLDTNYIDLVRGVKYILILWLSYCSPI